MITTKIARPLLGILLAATSPVHTTPAQAPKRNASDSKRAEALHVAGMFGDRMVLQQQTTVPIWGRATPHAEVRVAASWRDPVAKAVADARGAWRVDVATPAAGGPFTLAVESDGERREFSDVLAGEVWLCSGQSNMQWKLRGFGKDHFQEDVARANHPEVRFCQIPQVLGLQPQADLKTQWEACTPESVLPLSCVAYFFGEKLHTEIGVPIGLISTSWGGSSIEAWMDAEALAEEFPEFRPALDRNDAQAKQHGALFRGRAKRPRGLNQRRPSVLYNTMIRPIAPYAMRGVIWYQGESNVERPIQYRRLFPAMIDSWRREWGQGEFPFYYVQIAPFGYRNKKLPAALLREAQLQTLAVPKTGMVVTMDIGNPDNIHPKAKKPVGHRLARLALARDYGRSRLIDSGPEYVDHAVAGERIILRFRNVGGGLTSRDGKALSHFSIAGRDRVFHEAQATIAGDTVVVHANKVQTPVAVRYAWGNSDEPNLSNKEGLPSSSFRTDAWPIEAQTPAKKPAEKPGEPTRQRPAKQKPAPTKGDTKGQPGEKRPPNVVYIMSDEWAYYESSHMGNPKLRTPNIDRMAREGMRFTRALAAAPVCAPVRCCLMTGKHAGHASVRTNGGGTPIRAEEPTLATMLKSHGYATGGFGKWGIGGRGSEGVPENHGFDEFFGYYDQVHAHSFYTAHLVRNSEEVPLPGNKGGRVGETYSHYEIMKEGLAFIRRNKDRPFFCYLPITPPHGMYDIPADDPAFDLYRNSEWMQDPAVPQDAKNYAAMVSMIDRDLQRVLDLLKELSLDENTIVFFTGDNGGQDRFADDQHPRGFFGPNVNPKTGVAFRGQKRSLYDGALRIPFLVRWPGHIPAGQTSDHLFYQVDMMATLAELTQSELPIQGDGISIAPALLGADAAGHPQGQHETMYWEYGGQRAVRKGDWKAVRPGPKAEWELYELATDPSESQDQASKQPEILTELRLVAARSHERAVPGKFWRRDLQKRDRIARNGVPEPLTPRAPKPAAKEGREPRPPRTDARSRDCVGR
ncbi:MAG: sulfatase-like hydrolase/transferase [Planctomycetota bacterium]